MLAYLILSLGLLVQGSHGIFMACILTKCEQNCRNVGLLGHECYCDSGYIVDPRDSRRCIKEKPNCGYGFRSTDYPPYECADINECAEGSPCEQGCTNYNGGYTCTCRSGFVVNTNDRSRCNKIAGTKCPSGYRPNPKRPGQCIAYA